MQEFNYPHIRQVIINNLPITDRPGRHYFKWVRNILPDVKFHGFGKMYDGTWYLLIESLYFPYHVEYIATRAPVPATTLINYLPNKKAF